MAHEGYQRDDDKPSATPRGFGLLLATVLAVLTVLAWWKSSANLPIWGGLCASFVLIALLFPRILTRPLRVWMALGRGLAAIFNPVVLALMFGLMFVPMALWFRLRGRDVLARKPDPDATSYWIERESAKELGARMSRPF